MNHPDFLANDVFVLAQAVTPWVGNPNMVGAILGSSVGVFGAVFGTLCGTLAPRGKAKGLVLGMHLLGIAVGLIMLTLSIVALVGGQPYAIWYGLGLPGLILTAVLLPLTGVVRQRYREAEQRKLDAESFRRG